MIIYMRCAKNIITIYKLQKRYIVKIEVNNIFMIIYNIGK